MLRPWLPYSKLLLCKLPCSTRPLPLCSTPSNSRPTQALEGGNTWGEVMGPRGEELPWEGGSPAGPTEQGQVMARELMEIPPARFKDIS